MAANEIQEIRIIGKDYESVEEAIEKALGVWDEKDERKQADWKAVAGFLKAVNKESLRFLNKSAVREEHEKDEGIGLFFFAGKSNSGEQEEDSEQEQEPEPGQGQKQNPIDIFLNKSTRWNGVAGKIHGFWPKKKPAYEITVEIGSRFDEPDKYYFLLTMMQSWIRREVPTFLKERAQVSMEDVFRFLWVAIFKTHLIEAYNKGIYKAYQNFEDNSNRIRGAIDIARHIQLNGGLSNGKIATKYRKNTTDNFLNHLLIHTYLELKKLHPAIVSGLIDGDRDAHFILQTLMAQAPSYAKYDVRTVISVSRPISHPFFLHYEELRQTCLQILSYVGVSSFGENSAKKETQCMLFYTPDLWEAYLEDCVLPKTGFLWEAQPPAKDSILREKRADFVMNQGEDSCVVLDAKYKVMWADFSAKPLYIPSLLVDDVQQCLVYKALYRAKCTGTIFPVRSTENPNGSFQSRSISGSKKGDDFLAFGVGIPKIADQNFEDWRKEMKEREKRAAEKIRDQIDPGKASQTEEPGQKS